MKNCIGDANESLLRQVAKLILILENGNLCNWKSGTLQYNTDLNVSHCSIIHYMPYWRGLWGCEVFAGDRMAVGQCSLLHVVLMWNIMCVKCTVSRRFILLYLQAVAVLSMSASVDW